MLGKIEKELFIAFPTNVYGVALAICLLYEVEAGYLQGIFNAARIMCTRFHMMRTDHAYFQYQFREGIVK